MLLIEENYDVKRLTSLKCGGKIKKVIFPANRAEFEEALALYPDAKVFGNLTNTLVSSYGYDGEVILTTKMTSFSIDGEYVTADCGVKGPKLSQAAAEEGLSGFEFMIAFPGTVGGEVFMNAGAHGQSISDVFVEALCWSKDKGFITLKKEDMNFSYRTSVCQNRDIAIISAKFKLKKAEKETIKAKMQENLDFRKAKQPNLATPNCGSVFRNPEGDSAGRLLESAGAKSFSVNSARVWENHANFITNTNDAASTDILELMAKMQGAVKEKFNIKLKPEVRFLGGNDKREVELCKILYQK